MGCGSEGIRYSAGRLDLHPVPLAVVDRQTVTVQALRPRDRQHRRRIQTTRQQNNGARFTHGDIVPPLNEMRQGTMSLELRVMSYEFRNSQL